MVHYPVEDTGRAGKQTVRARLLANSMDVHGTYFSELDDLDDGEIRIKMDYSAANAYGGKVRTTAWARMGTDCEIINVTVYGYE